jgi:hypothetical protein
MVCQQSKLDRTKLPVLLQPLSVPDGAWSTISLDFVEGLHVSGSPNCILVVVDKFTKYGYFIPLKQPFTTFLVAKLFLDHIYKLHGLPTTIVSDHDKVFTSNLWRELFALADVKLCMSSAYHPQSNGQTERLNQCLETFLNYFVSACPRKWLQWLPLAEFWYNNSFIQLFRLLHLKLSMDMHLNILVCHWEVLVLWTIWMSDLRRDKWHLI